jgi:hypothetical protein
VGGVEDRPHDKRERKKRTSRPGRTPVFWSVEPTIVKRALEGPLFTSYLKTHFQTSLCQSIQARYR